MSSHGVIDKAARTSYFFLGLGCVYACAECITHIININITEASLYCRHGDCFLCFDVLFVGSYQLLVLLSVIPSSASCIIVIAIAIVIVIVSLVMAMVIFIFI